VGGGTGILDRLRPCWLKGHAGSNPAPRTNLYSTLSPPTIVVFGLASSDPKPAKYPINPGVVTKTVPSLSEVISYVETTAKGKYAVKYVCVVPIVESEVTHIRVYSGAPSRYKTVTSGYLVIIGF
jgi:hypothetical protein